MRILSIFLLVFVCNLTMAQNYCDCDTINKKYRFSGYCNEYIDINMHVVTKDKAQFITYVYYENGYKSIIYPFNYTGSKKSKYYLNKILFEKSNSIITLNGLIECYNKNGLVERTLFFKNGQLVKDINKGWGIFRSKKSFGKKTHEIVEYDYSSEPAKRHIIRYGFDGTIKINFYAKKDKDGQWHDTETKSIISEDPNIFYSIP